VLAMSRDSTKAIFAYNELKSLLHSGQLEINRVISTGEIADMIHMGRAPVTEALKKLESERYVIIIPQKGIMVRELTLQEMREINDLRQALEGCLVTKIASRFQNGDFSAVSDFLEQQRLAAEEGNPKKFIFFDEKFHMYLCEKTGNTLLIEVVQKLRERFFEAGLYVLSQPGRMKTTLEEHMRILDALVSNDPERAGKEMINHLENGKKLIV
jgi:DNA-binding GntR family transcriptional regulator